MNDNERHVETIWPPMFGFRLLPTNSDLIIIKKLFRAANFSGAGGDEKLKIIFNWPYINFNFDFLNLHDVFFENYFANELTRSIIFDAI